VGYPGLGKHVYLEEVTHTSRVKPYTFEFTSTTGTITEIACCPVEHKSIQSPEIKVTDGGVNHTHVHIYLQPTVRGEWGYLLSITTKDNETTASQQVRLEWLLGLTDLSLKALALRYASKKPRTS
jgi:hypothetical protein